MSLKRNVIRSSALNIADQVVKLVAVFLITPLMIKSLGQHAYGVWLLLMTFLRYYELLDFGLGISFSRFAAVEIGAGSTGGLGVVNGIMGAFFRRIALSALTITGVAVALCPLFLSDEELINPCRTVLAVVGANFALRFYLRPFQILLKSHVRYDYLVLGSLLKVTIQTAAFYWVLTGGYGFVGLAIALVASEFVEQFVVVTSCRKFTGADAFRSAARDPAKTKEILRYAWVTFLNTVGTNLRYQTDPTIIGILVGAKMVPFYTIGTRFLNLLTDLVNALFGGPFLSAFSQLKGKGETEVLRDAFSRTMRISAVVSVFGVASVAVFAGPFIDRWIGPEFEMAYRVTLAIAFPYTAFLIQQPALAYLWSLNRQEKFVWLRFTSSLVNVVLSIALGLAIGFMGVVWATVIEMFVFYLLIFPPLFCRLAGFSTARYYIHLLAWPSLKTLIPLALYYALIRQWLIPEYPRILLLAAGQMIFFAPVAWFLIIDREDRGLIRQAMLSRRKTDADS